MCNHPQYPDLLGQFIDFSHVTDMMVSATTIAQLADLERREDSAQREMNLAFVTGESAVAELVHLYQLVAPSSMWKIESFVHPQEGMAWLHEQLGRRLE